MCVGCALACSFSFALDEGNGRERVQAELTPTLTPARDPAWFLETIPVIVPAVRAMLRVRTRSRAARVNQGQAVEEERRPLPSRLYTMLKDRQQKTRRKRERDDRPPSPLATLGLPRSST